jgi:putative colanic acid biosynthesis UDP-glucose lipid carrier transferase
MDKSHGIKTHGTEFALLYRSTDILVIFSTLMFCAQAYIGSIHTSVLTAALLAIVTFMLTAESIALYRSWRTATIKEQILAPLTCWIAALVVVVFWVFFSKSSEQYSRVVMGSWAIVTPTLLICWRLVVRQLLIRARKMGFNRRRAIIIGVTENGVRLAKESKSNPEFGIDLVGFYDDRDLSRLEISDLPVPYKGTIEQGLKLTKKHVIDHVYIAMPMRADERIALYLKQFSDTTANTYVIPEFFVYNLIQSRLSSIGTIPTLSVHDTPFYGFNIWSKRLQDIVLASLIILLISPVLLAVAIGVKLSSPGPIIFKQKRYGLDGRQIKVWKFRSMSTMDNGATVKQATKNDPRVTKFGAFIRRTSLDELPQFFNVLQGRMSIVGPRPHAVAHNEQYRAIVDRYMLRHKVKPGITGLAQISGYRGETDTLEKMEKRVECDLEYIQSWSTYLDLKIIFLTVFKGFVGKTAY